MSKSKLLGIITKELGALWVAGDLQKIIMVPGNEATD